MLKLLLMVFVFLSVFPSRAFADEFSCSTADPEVTYNAMTASWAGYPDGDMYEFTLGAGGGSVTWAGQALTHAAVLAVVAQGPSGHQLNFYGHFKDPTGDTIDHYLWLWTEKSDGRKYLWVLTDRSITGDADPRKYGAVQVVWAAKYSRAPVSGDSWPSVTDIAENSQKDISTYMQKFESLYLSGGSGGLIAQAKANCAATYGATVCNAKVWKRTDRRTLIFPSNTEYETFVATYDGTAFLHDPADPNDDDTDAIAQSWIIIWMGGCSSGCQQIPQSDCERICFEEKGQKNMNGCAWGRNPGNYGGPCDALQCWRGGCANVIAPDSLIPTW